MDECCGEHVAAAVRHLAELTIIAIGHSPAESFDRRWCQRSMPAVLESVSPGHNGCSVLDTHSVAIFSAAASG